MKNHQVFIKKRKNKKSTIYFFDIKVDRNEVVEIIGEDEIKKYRKYRINLSESLIHQQHKNLQNQSGIVSLGGRTPYHMISSVKDDELKFIINGIPIKK